jgi:mono/diheme cytochrome c family protein
VALAGAGLAFCLAGSGLAQPAGSPPSSPAAAAPAGASTEAPPGGVPGASPAPAPGGGAANGLAPPADFSPEYLADSRNVDRGRAVWLARCQFCHGRAAYPGKAPRLDPSRYTPDFVYDRVANGFRGMPSWRHEFSIDELKAVVAYVLSKRFPD